MIKTKKLMNNDIAEEILSAVNESSEKTDRRLENLEESIKSMRVDMTDLRTEVTDMRTGVTDMRSKMVTKDYLDDKLADLRGDLVVLMRKEDNKLRLLVDKLCERKVLNEQDKQDILKLEPFPQLNL